MKRSSGTRRLIVTAAFMTMGIIYHPVVNASMVPITFAAAVSPLFAPVHAITTNGPVVVDSVTCTGYHTVPRPCGPTCKVRMPDPGTAAWTWPPVSGTFVIFPVYRPIGVAVIGRCPLPRHPGCHASWFDGSRCGWNAFPHPAGNLTTGSRVVEPVGGSVPESGVRNVGEPELVDVPVHDAECRGHPGRPFHAGGPGDCAGRPGGRLADEHLGAADEPVRPVEHQRIHAVDQGQRRDVPELPEYVALEWGAEVAGVGRGPAGRARDHQRIARGHAAAGWVKGDAVERGREEVRVPGVADAGPALRGGARVEDVEHAVRAELRSEEHT